jgi:transcriptional regulator with XRE-family HTH domain
MPPEPNHLLRAARERLPSPAVPGEGMSRRELAEAVAAWLWKNTAKRFDLDVRLIAKWERGEVRWPSAAYRAALRAVIDVASDAELGFRPNRHRVAGELVPVARQFAATGDDVEEALMSAAEESSRGRR